MPNRIVGRDTKQTPAAFRSGDGSVAEKTPGPAHDTAPVLGEGQ